MEHHVGCVRLHALGTVDNSDNDDVWVVLGLCVHLLHVVAKHLDHHFCWISCFCDVQLGIGLCPGLDERDETAHHVVFVIAGICRQGGVLDHAEKSKACLQGAVQDVHHVSELVADVGAPAQHDWNWNVLGDQCHRH